MKPTAIIGRGGLLGGTLPKPPFAPVAPPWGPPRDFGVPDINAPRVIRSDTNAPATTQTDNACATCPKCTARDAGFIVPNHYGNVTPAAKIGYEYQNQVCPWFAHDKANNTIMEWAFFGVTFDGISPTNCILYEAKHGYDSFLQPTSNGLGYEYVPWARKSGVGKNIFNRMIQQAAKQVAVIQPFKEVSLYWVFSSRITANFFQYLIKSVHSIVNRVSISHRPFK